MDKKSKSSKQKLFDAYTTQVLENEKEPKSVFLFCKKIGISEAEFYEHFGSLEHLKAQIFCVFFDNTHALITKDSNYQSQSPQEKLLAFYFTFFEVLKLNRSYVLYVLNGSGTKLEKFAVLKDFRLVFKSFIVELIREGNATKHTRFTQHPEALFSEGAWAQLLFLIKFWIDDTSPTFEKTDMAIEKSVRSVFDLFDNTPLDSIVDFGKFLFKEKIRWAN